MEYDFIVVGSGIAGLYTALLAQEHGRVLVVTKAGLEECNTRYAQGGIAAAVGSKDSPRQHYRDTLGAGAGLCNRQAVRVLTEEGPARIAELIDLGMHFDTVQGEIALTREAAHSLPRVLHARGDATGMEIELTLARLARFSRVDLWQHRLVTRVLVQGGRAVGIEAVDLHQARRQQVRGRNVVLATGGGGRLFFHTTNPPVATGDGVALAYRAGAEVESLEFYQFHPTCLYHPGAPPFLISEAVRGEGGLLRNEGGERFMEGQHPLAELAPRDIVARAITREMQRTEQPHVYLDVTHLPPERIRLRFPTIYRTCRELGLDITQDWIPVAPAAHYMIGGIRVDLWGRTNLPGLFACGEVACTGAHGANRLASNSLLEVLVFVKRLVQLAADGSAAASQEQAEEAFPLLRTAGPPGQVPQEDEQEVGKGELRRLMWDLVGIERDAVGLKRALSRLAGWRRARPVGEGLQERLELEFMLLTASLMAQAALLRQESRGAHYRSDYPESAPDWQRVIVQHLP
ncbi:MAG: L-aspartate oxidase [Chloroflexia bacterium]|nr:L-aspartate oxidase [Chloroflexia bacterium]